MTGVLRSMCHFVPMIVAQHAGPQRLDRIQEPEALTAAEANVAQYNQVMGTKLAIGYAGGLEAIYRLADVVGGSALDLACGPGHFTLCLARYLGYTSVTGVDLAEPMVGTGNSNAAKLGLASQVRFVVGDATRLTSIASQSMDL